MMDEKKLDELMTMKLEERWQELLADADDAIQQEEDRIEARMNPRKKPEKRPEKKDEKDRAEEK